MRYANIADPEQREQAQRAMRNGVQLALGAHPQVHEQAPPDEVGRDRQHPEAQLEVDMRDMPPVQLQEARAEPD